MFSCILVIIILIIKSLNDDSVIDALFKLAGYTYGPLLGLYAFGMTTEWNITDRYVPIITILSPLLCFVISQNSIEWFNYEFGFELLILNGLITFIGLDILRKDDYNWKP